MNSINKAIIIGHVPMAFQWTDEGVMRPLTPRAADRQYVIGEVYRLDHSEAPL